VRHEGCIGNRIRTADAARGVVAILMALDHVRDFIHSAAMSFSPTDLTYTTAAIFLTRRVTHTTIRELVPARAHHHTVGELALP
jgi:uncharacterized membrane protein